MTCVEVPVGRKFFSCRFFAVFFLFLTASALAQSPPVQATPAANTTTVPDTAAPELTTHDEPTTFKVNVRLVLVRVVARDGQGHAVGNLHKEDFQLLDNGKAQVITQFSVEQPGSQVAKEQQTQIPGAEGQVAGTPNVPERFVAYVFDDYHLGMPDLVAVRRAVAATLPTDRVGLFTISGDGDLDFTDDHAKLQEGLLRIHLHPGVAAEIEECPHMTHYMADQIVNKMDMMQGGALDLATQEVMGCMPGISLRAAQEIAMGAARQELSIGDHAVQLLIASLKNIVRRVSAAPGQRSIVFVSPGFIAPEEEHQWEMADVIDHALRANIIINTLDARGLYVLTEGNPQRYMFEVSQGVAYDEPLSLLADSTGGFAFQNTNDFAGAFKKATATPEYSYVLGFSPQNLKYDGRFHKLTVKLNNGAKLTLQARKGYYAPKQSANAEEQAKQEIEEALLSRDEMHDLPVELKTRFYKPTDLEAKLDVIAQIDVKQLHFPRADGRNNESLTVAAALFDHNGTFVAGDKKIVEMRLKDETLESKLDRGVTLKTSFDVKPGSYLVRLVVRDTEGQLSAENGAIDIP
jgi:VWFA-related protein